MHTDRVTVILPPPFPVPPVELPPLRPSERRTIPAGCP